MSVVIPTRFRSQHLETLIRTAQQVTTVILVHTEPGHAPVRGCVNLHDYRRNIQAWWNTGLNEAGDKALVLNDDIATTPESFTTLLDALDDHDLIWIPGRVGVTPISGWCYGIRPEAIRPDEAFVWWYGDDDLYKRAIRDNLRTAVLDVPVLHDHPGPAFPDEFTRAVRSDRALYYRRWGAR